MSDCSVILDTRTNEIQLTYRNRIVLGVMEPLKFKHSRAVRFAVANAMLRP